MQEAEILDAAFQLLDQFRGNAELRAGEEMDRAMERGDTASFDRWRGRWHGGAIALADAY